MVDVSPDVCLNSTDETNRNRGGCIFHEFCCCNDIEWVKCGIVVVASDMLPIDEPPNTADDPFPALVGFIVIASESSLMASLFVAVELVVDSLRGGCRVCCVNCVHRAATGRESM